MLQKIVLKVFVRCNRCKTCILKTVAKLEGITTLTLDEEKSTLTVLGEVDVCLIVKKLRGVKKMVAVESVGPPPEEKKEEKKEEKNEEKKNELPAHCSSCRPGIIFLEDYPYAYNGCSVL